MARLKDRQRQIPNGFKFALPEVGYVSPPFVSFDVLVNQVFAIIQANPGKASASGWPLTREETAYWIDQFQAAWCVQNGWMDYVTGSEGDPPKHGPPPGKSSALAAGAKTIAEWLGAGAQPAAPELSASRAAICAACPLNKPGDFGDFFERATSELLRKQVEHFRNEDLRTPDDDRLGVCSACFCPMKLKVHFPLDFIMKNLSPQSLAAFDKNCWIIGESA